MLVTPSGLILKFASLMSKKELKLPSMTDSILIRALSVSKSIPSGISTDSEPSLGVLSASTCVKAMPPLGESEIFTLAQLIGADAVFAARPDDGLPRALRP